MNLAAVIAGVGGVGSVIAFAWWLVSKLLGYVDRYVAEKQAHAEAKAALRGRAAQISTLKASRDTLQRRVGELEEAKKRAVDRLHRARKAAKDEDSGALDSALRDGLRDLEERTLHTP